MICVILFVRLSFSYRLWRRAIPYSLSNFDYGYTASVTSQQRMYILLQRTRSYHHICQKSVLPCSLFCFCSLGFDYVYHIVKFAILYFVLRSYPLEKKILSLQERSICPILFHLCSIKETKLLPKLLRNTNVLSTKLFKTRHWINSSGCI
jgi:hypothetical protein